MNFRNSKYKLLIIFGILAVLIVLALALVWLSRPKGESFLTLKIEEILTKALMQPVSIEKLETNLFSRIDIVGIKVLSNNEPPVTVIEIPSVRARYSLIGMLFSGISLDSVLISSLNIDLRRDSLGEFNFSLLNPKSSAGTPEKSGKSLRFSVGYIDLKKSDWLYGDQVINLDGALEELSAVVHLDNLSKLDFTIKANSLDVSNDSALVPLGEFYLAGGWHSPSLIVDSLSIMSDDLQAISSGKLSFEESIPAVKAKLILSGSFPGRLDSLAAMQFVSFPQIEGELNVVASVEGAFDDLGLQAHLNSINLTWNETSAQFLKVDAVGRSASGVWTFQTDAVCSLLTFSSTTIPFVSLSATAILSDSLTAINDLVLALPDFSIKGSSEFRPIMDDTLVVVALAIQGALRDVTDLIGSFTSPAIGEIEGSINLAFNVSGSVKKPEVHLKGSFPVIKNSDLLITNLNINCSYVGESLTLDVLEGDMYKGHFSATGDLNSRTLYHHFALNATEIDLYKFLTNVYDSTSRFEGFVNARVKSSGKLDNPFTYLLDARISLDTVEYADLAIPPFKVVIAGDSGIVDLNFVQGESRIQAHAKLFKDSLNGDFGLHLPDIGPYAALVNQQNVSGKLDLSGTINGRYSDPTIIASVLGQQVLYQDFPVDTLRADIALSAGELTFNDVFITGTIIDIDTLRSPFGLEGISGGMTYRGEMQGTLSDPVVALTMSVNDFSYHDVQLNSGSLVVTTVDRTIKLEEFHLESDSLNISGKGFFYFDSTAGNLTLAFSSSIPDSLASDSLASETVQRSLYTTYSKKKSKHDFYVEGSAIPIGTFMKLMGLKDVNGNLDILVTAELEDELKVTRFEAKISDIRLAKARLDSLVVKGYLNSTEMNLTELGVHSKGSLFNAFGKINRNPRQLQSEWFADDNQVEAGFTGNIADFTIFKPFMPPGYSAEGACVMDLAIKGRLDHPKINGLLKLTDGKLVAEGKPPLLDSLQADVTMTDSLLVINYITGIYHTVPLSVVADVKFKSVTWFNANAVILANGTEVIRITSEVRRETLDAQLILNNLDLALVEPMIPGIDAFGGIANASVKVTGSKKDPEIIGELAVEKLYLSPLTMADSLLNCSLRVSIDRQAVIISNFYGEFGGGTIIASGKYGFVEESAASGMKIQIRDSRVFDSDKYTLRVKQGDLSVTNSKKQLLVEGDVVLGESHLRSRFTPKSFLSMLQSTERPVVAKASILDKVRLDIRIRDSEDIWIDNNLARLKLKAELALAGSLNKPAVSGRITAAEGYVLYLDRKFNVDHASLDFYDPHRINPFIDVLASTEVKSYNSKEETPHTISLVINGELDKATVALTSIPPEELSDILALLTLGITRRDLSGVDGKQGDVKFQEAVRQRVELITSRRVSGYLGSNVESYFGLSSFTIENNLFQFDKNWGPQLVASKKLSSRTEITYTTTVGRINDQGVKLAYKFTERLAIEGQTDKVGRSGIDLIYKLKLP